MSVAPRSPDSPTILVMEDNDIYRQVVCMALKRQFAASLILEAASLAQAQRLIGQQPLDVVVTDLTLPDGSGLDLLPFLAKDLSSGAKLVALSNESARDVLAGLTARGYHGFVAKEHGLQAVVAAIRSVLAGETFVSQQT